MTADAHRFHRRCGSALLFAVSIGVFGWMVASGMESDVRDHAHVGLAISRGLTERPANFLYYLVIHLVAGASVEPGRNLLASVLVLSVAVAAKFWITHALIARSSGAPPRTVTAFALATVFAFSLPTAAIREGTWYAGQIPPNVWHNSTTIFLMPFALLLFRASARALEHPSARLDRRIALWTALNVAIKPSFFFVQGLVYPAELLLRLGPSRALLRHLWPVALGALLVLAQYALIFVLEVGSLNRRESGVGIYPFVAWSRHSSSIPQSLAASFLFPAAAFALLGREPLRDRAVRYALALAVVGVAIMALVSETGPRWWHGNFFWQAYMGNYLLFATLGAHLAGHIARGAAGPRVWLAVGALGLHVAWGLVYLGRLLVEQDFH